MEPKRPLWLYLVLLLAVASAGCDLVGDIFQAGFTVGLLVVALVAGLILFVVLKLRT